MVLRSFVFFSNDLLIDFSRYQTRVRVLSRIGCLSLEQAREDLDLIRACNARILEVYSLEDGESTWKDFVILTLTARISESCLEEDVGGPSRSSPDSIDVKVGDADEANVLDAPCTHEAQSRPVDAPSQDSSGSSSTPHRPLACVSFPIYRRYPLPPFRGSSSRRLTFRPVPTEVASGPAVRQPSQPTHLWQHFPRPNAEHPSKVGVL